MGLRYKVGELLLGTRELLAREHAGMAAGARALSSPSAAAAGGFSGISTGKPLCIEIRHVYTGREPRSDWAGWGDKDLLVTSSLKSITDYAAAVRAVNQLRVNVPQRSHIKRPAATEPGTPLVYYSPAVTVSSMAVTIELFFDNFPDDVVTAAGEMMKSAAGIPIFATASVFLAGASIVAGIVARLGKALFDGTPVFRETEEIIFFSPGQDPSEAGLVLLMADQYLSGLDEGYTIGKDGILVDRASGNRYKGDAPYVVLAIDGTPRPDLESFQATKISAELLDRFASVKGAASAGMDALLAGSQAFNDLSFRRRADALRERLKGDPTSEDYQAAKAQWDAFVKNIRNAELKPVLT